MLFSRSIRAILCLVACACAPHPGSGANSDSLAAVSISFGSEFPPRAYTDEDPQVAGLGPLHSDAGGMAEAYAEVNDHEIGPWGVIFALRAYAYTEVPAGRETARATAGVEMTNRVEAFHGVEGDIFKLTRFAEVRMAADGFLFADGPSANARIDVEPRFRS
jgi:hypothetical protein